ncbi:hypothetical protein [Candidatus Vidania fulgoroideorum]
MNNKSIFIFHKNNKNLKNVIYQIIFENKNKLKEILNKSYIKDRKISLGMYIFKKKLFFKKFYFIE